MKKLSIVLVVVAFAFSIAIPTPAIASVGQSYPLYAGKTTHVGEVVVFNDGDNITVKFELKAPWKLFESHIDVATDVSGIPQTKKGNPIPGKFKYKSNMSWRLYFIHNRNKSYK